MAQMVKVSATKTGFLSRPHMAERESLPRQVVVRPCVVACLPLANKRTNKTTADKRMGKTIRELNQDFRAKLFCGVEPGRLPKPERSWSLKPRADTWRLFPFGKTCSFFSVHIFVFCLYVPLSAEKLISNENKSPCICCPGGEFCSVAASSVSGDASATPGLRAEAACRAFAGARPSSSEVSQNAAYYFYKRGLCLF